MEAFRISESDRKKVVLQDSLFIGAYYLCLLAVIFLTGYFSHLSKASLISNLSTFAFIFIYYMVRQVNEMNRYYKTYSLEVEDNHVTEWYNGIVQSQFRPERAIRTEKGNLAVYGSDDIQITIPSIISEKDRLASLLPMDKGFYQREPKWTLVRKLFKYPLLLLATLFSCFIIGNMAVRLITGSLLIFLMAVSIWHIQKSKAYSSREKNFSWILLLFVFYILFTIILGVSRQ